ncbi:hypothetical protein N0V86_003575 [Didymella sp. IMI 355093]|nr:hypothetical protein N0V86_003575 [Didymella sp. IMI 355093]
MSADLFLHTQDLTKVMFELDRIKSANSRMLHELAERGSSTKTANGLHRSLQATFPLDSLPDTKQIKNILMNEIGGKNSFHFVPTRGTPETDAQAIVALLNNIENPSYSTSGAILNMVSPTFEGLFQFKVNWPEDGMLGSSHVNVAVTPADDVQDTEYYDTYTLYTLLHGSKVWLAYPPLPRNLAALQEHYRLLAADDYALGMNNAQNFQRGILIVQQAGQSLVMPPFWTATAISTQIAVSATYHATTATALVERIKHISDFRLTCRLDLSEKTQEQSRLILFASELVDHLQRVLEDAYAHCKISKVITEICREYETLRTGLRQMLPAINDKAIARGLGNKSRAVWLRFLEEKRKKNPACRCAIRAFRTCRLEFQLQIVSASTSLISIVCVEKKQKINDIVSSNEEEAVKIDQIAKIRGWFRPEEDSAYYPIVQQYLQGDIDLDTATSKLFDPIDQKIIAQELDDIYFVDLWYSIIHSAKRKPFHEAEDDGKRNAHFHAKVADLITAFRDHKIDGHEEYDYIYSSFYDLGMACREVNNDEPEPHATSVEIDAWTNVNFFWARLTEKGLVDLSLYAIWRMRTALEEEHQDDSEGTAVQKHDVYVPAAVSWIFGMGRALYTKEKDLTPTDRKQGNPAKGGELWEGKAEFSKARWALWKKRLGYISKLEGVSDKTKSISRDALEAMERAESFSAYAHSAGAGS